MKIIFNKYGGLKTIEDRQLLVQSSDNANYIDIYYQDDAGNFADETVNLATIAFKRSDSFEISERTCDAVREELTNKILYFRYIFKEDELAINGELQITVRLKQVTFDPEDETQILLVKQRTMGKLVAHIYEAVGTDYEEYNVIDGRLLQLELWQSTFDGNFYGVTQIDAIVAQEVLNRNQAITNHDNNANAHASIRENIGNRINQAVAVETNAREELQEAFNNHQHSYDEIIDKPVSVIFEITSFAELTTLQKTTITNQLMPLLKVNLTDLDTNKYSDLILKYLDERYHYSSVAVIDGEVVRILFDYKNEDTKIKLDINFVGDDSQTVIELVTINYEQEGAVSTHNASELAHSYIRNTITNLDNSLSVVAKSGDYNDLLNTPTQDKTVFLDLTNEEYTSKTLSSNTKNEIANAILGLIKDGEFQTTDIVLRVDGDLKQTLVSYYISNNEEPYIVLQFGANLAYNDYEAPPYKVLTITNSTVTLENAEDYNYNFITRLGYGNADFGSFKHVASARGVNGNYIHPYARTTAPVLYDFVKGELNDKIASLKGQNNGLAELDAYGKVPSTQLPSYVDDVLEYAKLADFPATGEDGKIYVAKDTNLTYRWSGSGYTEISASLALGETSSTAYAGDKGKIAYDHSQTAHAPSNAQKNVQSDWQQATETADDYIKNKPTIPTIPNIELNNYGDTTNKYISKIEVDAANKHKLNITTADLPTSSGGVEQVQSDWLEDDDTSKAFILNKPENIVLYVEDLTAISDLEKQEITTTIWNLYSEFNPNTLINDILLVELDNIGGVAKVYHYESFYDEEGVYLNIFFRTELYGVLIKSHLSDAVDAWMYTNIVLSPIGSGVEQIQSNWLESDDTSKAYIQNKPLDVILQIANISTLTSTEKEAITNQIYAILNENKTAILSNKYDDILLKTPDRIYHYTNINILEEDVVIFFTFIDGVGKINSCRLFVNKATYNLTSIAFNTIEPPPISTSITTDATSDTKTASPKAVKTYVDNVVGDILTILEGI